MNVIKHVKNAYKITYGTKSATFFFWHLELENVRFYDEAIVLTQWFIPQRVREKIAQS